MILKNKRQKIKKFFNYNFFPKNRKGAEKILSVYWFAILVLVSAGVFSIVFSFQSPYDVRVLESNVLTGQVADCLAPQGVLNPEIPKNFGISSIEKIEDPTLEIEKLNQSLTEDSSCKCDDDSCWKYAEWIVKYSTENKIIDPLLVAGLMVQESFCVPTAGTGTSHGLMQINLVHCGKFGLPEDQTACKNELITNPEKNIEVGTLILNDSFYSYGINGKKFSDACTSEYQQKTYFGWEAALRGYNGWGCGVFKQGSKIGQEITSQDYYVDNVLVRYNKLREFLGKDPVTGTMKIDLLKTCHLNFGDEKDSQYYFESEFTNFTSEKVLGIAKEGSINLRGDCFIETNSESKTLAKCTEKSFYSVDENNEKYIIKILSAVRKTEQNIDG